MITKAFLAGLFTVITTSSANAVTNSITIPETSPVSGQVTVSVSKDPYNNIGFYVGGKVGTLTMTKQSYDNVINAGIYAGYQLTPWFAFEAEYSRNVNGGNINIYAINGEYDINNFAIYAAFKTTRRVYYKGRIGLSKQTVSHKIDQSFFTIQDSGNVDYSGLSISSGVGINLPNSLAIEAEVTLMDASENLSAMFTLGLKYKF